MFGCKPGWGRRCVVRGLGGVRAPCPLRPPRLGGCSELGALQETGDAAIPMGGVRGLCPSQPSYHRFWGTEGLQDLHMGWGAQSTQSAAGRGEYVCGHGGAMRGLGSSVRGGFRGVVLVKEGGGGNGEKGWLAGRCGIRGAAIAPSLCWWQKCRLRLLARSAHCSASHLAALHPNALAVNLEMGGLRESGLCCAGTEAAEDLQEGSASPYMISAA